MGRRIVVAAITATAVVASTASLAFAGGPPTGTYYCASGYSLKIASKGHYRFTVSPGGTFAYAKAAHKLTFKSGYLKKDWYGKFRRDATSGSPIIDLLLKDGSGSDSCYR